MKCIHGWLWNGWPWTWHSYPFCSRLFDDKSIQQHFMLFRHPNERWHCNFGSMHLNVMQKCVSVGQFEPMHKTIKIHTNLFRSSSSLISFVHVSTWQWQSKFGIQISLWTRKFIAIDILLHNGHYSDLDLVGGCWGFDEMRFLCFYVNSSVAKFVCWELLRWHTHTCVCIWVFREY